MNETPLTTSDELEIFKALANENRLLILQWLKHPEQHFPPHKEVEGFDNGVCVAFIQAKLNLSQAATSQYLGILQKAGLLIATRIGKWTYYRRDEKALTRFVDQLKDAI
ncbi:MAG: winged helix-turn-helix transcriptional regulator [Anaerolineae bacterium]|nr:winged helix-turn-helix transcriptional regulator [Anaerolineae bacterium]